jgi:hypothetical protein
VEGQGRTVINVIKIFMRIVRIVHNKRAPQAIAVLCGNVGVVPERAGLIWYSEIVHKLLALRDGTLCHEGGAVCPVGRLLEYTVPMLEKKVAALIARLHDRIQRLTIVVSVSITRSVKLLITLS